MKQILLLSFDLIRNGEPQISLAMGYLLSRLRTDPGYEVDFIARHISFNLYDDSAITIETVLDTVTSKYRLAELDFIAISCYAWSDFLTNDLISALRRSGFTKTIILGGYQISYTDNNELQRRLTMTRGEQPRS